MHALLAAVWKRLSGRLHWYILYALHAKFMVGVTGVVRDDAGRVLLLRHRYWTAGTWGLPGGYAGRSEPFERTLAREVAEETGLRIEVVRLLRVVSGYRLRAELIYLARVVGDPTPKPDGREVLEARFCTPDALPDGTLATHRRLIAAVAADAPTPSLS